MDVRLSAAQWTTWQDGTAVGINFRAGYLAGAAAVIAGDIGIVVLQQPNGTTIASFVRQSTWVQA